MPDVTLVNAKILLGRLNGRDADVLHRLIYDYEQVIAKHLLLQKTLIAAQKESDQRNQIALALVETLEFYADPDTYFAVSFVPDPPCGAIMRDFSESEDYGKKPGKRARETIERLNKQLNGSDDDSAA